MLTTEWFKAALLARLFLIYINNISKLSPEVISVSASPRIKIYAPNGRLIIYCDLIP